MKKLLIHLITKLLKQKQEQVMYAVLYPDDDKRDIPWNRIYSTKERAEQERDQFPSLKPTIHKVVIIS